MTCWASTTAPAELAGAESIWQAHARRDMMLSGVTMQAPDTVHLSWDTEIGSDTVIEPNVVFGRGVTVGQNATIHAFSHLERCRVGDGAEIGPYARLRPDADIGSGAKVGNFVEIKKATLGPGAKVNHLTYIGDAEIGARANISAGTITCNYDENTANTARSSARALSSDRIRRSSLPSPSARTPMSPPAA